MKKTAVFTPFLFTVMIFTAVSAFAESVAININASNATDKSKEKMEVRQDLPREIKKDDVIDAGGLNVVYDEEKTIYYVTTQVDLGPKETKTYKVVVRDVWNIPVEEIDFLSGQADHRLKGLESGEHYQIAKPFRDRVVAQAEEIKTQQTAQKGDISARIDSYRVNSQRLSDIRQAVTLTEDFIKEAERYADFEKDNRTMKFIIDSKNPSEGKAEGTEISRYLPQGIRPDNIIEPQGFELKYDNEKKLFYLTQKVDFEPGEQKKFEVVISDLWHIPEPKLDGLDEATQTISLKVVGTEYDKLAAYLVLEIKKYISEIKQSQKEAVTPEDKIAVYAVNMQKMEAIQQKINQLRKMVEDIENKKTKKISEVIKSVTPDVATTWKLIYATIGFLAAISMFFYILWWGQAKAKQGQKLEEYEDNKTKE